MLDNRFNPGCNCCGCEICFEKSFESSWLLPSGTNYFNNTSGCNWINQTGTWINATGTGVITYDSNARFYSSGIYNGNFGVLVGHVGTANYGERHVYFNDIDVVMGPSLSVINRTTGSGTILTGHLSSNNQSEYHCMIVSGDNLHIGFIENTTTIKNLCVSTSGYPLAWSGDPMWTWMKYPLDSSTGIRLGFGVGEIVSGYNSIGCIRLLNVSTGCIEPTETSCDCYTFSEDWSRSMPISGLIGEHWKDQSGNMWIDPISINLIMSGDCYLRSYPIYIPNTGNIRGWTYQVDVQKALDRSRVNINAGSFTYNNFLSSGGNNVRCSEFTSTQDNSNIVKRSHVTTSKSLQLDYTIPYQELVGYEMNKRIDVGIPEYFEIRTTGYCELNTCYLRIKRNPETLTTCTVLSGVVKCPSLHGEYNVNPPTGHSLSDFCNITNSSLSIGMITGQYLGTTGNYPVLYGNGYIDLNLTEKYRYGYGAQTIGRRVWFPNSGDIAKIYLSVEANNYLEVKCANSVGNGGYVKLNGVEANRLYMAIPRPGDIFHMGLYHMSGFLCGWTDAGSVTTYSEEIGFAAEPNHARIQLDGNARVILGPNLGQYSLSAIQDYERTDYNSQCTNCMPTCCGHSDRFNRVLVNVSYNFDPGCYLTTGNFTVECEYVGTSFHGTATINGYDSLISYSACGATSIFGEKTVLGVYSYFAMEFISGCIGSSIFASGVNEVYQECDDFATYTLGSATCQVTVP